jgi:hypothetical protein
MTKDETYAIAVAISDDWQNYCEGLGGEPDGDDYLITLIRRELAKAYSKGYVDGSAKGSE